MFNTCSRVSSTWYSRRWCNNYIPHENATAKMAENLGEPAPCLHRRLHLSNKRSPVQRTHRSRPRTHAPVAWRAVLNDVYVCAAPNEGEWRYVVCSSARNNGGAQECSPPALRITTKQALSEVFVARGLLPGTPITFILSETVRSVHCCPPNTRAARSSDPNVWHARTQPAFASARSAHPLCSVQEVPVPAARYLSTPRSARHHVCTQKRRSKRYARG